MAQRIDDRWLWLGAGVVGFAVVKGIQYALADIVRLTKIDPYQFEPKKKNEEHPEDSKRCFSMLGRLPPVLITLPKLLLSPTSKS